VIIVHLAQYLPSLIYYHLVKSFSYLKGPFVGFWLDVFSRYFKSVSQGAASIEKGVL